MQRNTAFLGSMVPALGACLVISVACGGGSGAPAASPEAGADAPSADTSAADASATGTDSAKGGDAAAPTESKDAASATGADKAAPQQSLLALCEEGCKKIRTRCTETAFENCKMNCAQYDHPPAGCETEVRQALECARDAEDVPCVNIAPEICSYKFRRVVACVNGKPIEAKDDAPRTPEGWERFVAKSAGFTAMAPKGMTESGGGAEARHSVQLGDAEYIVRVLPAPKEKPTQKNMLGVAMGVLGKCSQKLKLFGMVDRPEKVFIRFDSACPDGVTWRGAFVIVGSKMYMPYVAIAKAAKSKPEVDAFVYGLEVGGK
jgi:hypothetical protein